MKKKVLLVLLSIFLTITSFTVNVFASDLGDAPTLYDVLHTRPDFAYDIDAIEADAYGVSWYNSNDYYLFCTEDDDYMFLGSLDKEYSDEIKIDLTETLTKDNNNYKITTDNGAFDGSETIDLTFVMNDDNILDYIDVNAPESPLVSGKYGSTISLISGDLSDSKFPYTNDNGYMLFYDYVNSLLKVTFNDTTIKEIPGSAILSYYNYNNQTFLFKYSDGTITITFYLEEEPDMYLTPVKNITVSGCSTDAANGSYVLFRAGHEYWTDREGRPTIIEEDRAYKVRVNNDLETVTLIDSLESAFSYEFSDNYFRFPSFIYTSSKKYPINNIGDNSLSNITIFESASIYNNLDRIGNNAFNGCSNLSVLTFYSETPPTLGSGAFDNCHDDLVIYVPINSIDAYKTNNTWSPYIDRIRPIYLVDNIINTVPDFIHKKEGIFSGTTAWKNQNGAFAVYEEYNIGEPNYFCVLKFYKYNEGVVDLDIYNDSHLTIVSNEKYTMDLYDASLDFNMNDNVLSSITLTDVDYYFDDEDNWDWYASFNGTYTPYTTIASVLDTVEGGFSCSVDNETVPENAWAAPDGTRLFYASDKSQVYISNSPFIINPFETVTKDIDGNFNANITIDFFGTHNIDIKFVMDNDVLQKIEATLDSTETYIFEPLGDRITIATLLDTYASDFPTSSNKGWVRPSVIDNVLYRADINNLDSLCFSKHQDDSLPLFRLLNLSDSNYLFDLYDFKINFIIDDNKLQYIQIENVPDGLEDILGTYSAPVYVSDITNLFPQTRDTGWVNEKGERAYIVNDVIKIGSYQFSLNTLLVEDGDNYSYTYPFSSTKFVFIMANDIIDYIEVTGSITETDNGIYDIYEFVNEPIIKTKGYKGELVFKTYATYTDPLADVVVKVNSTTIRQGIDYKVEHGSTIVTLLSDYVSTLTGNSYLITIEVDGYPSIDQLLTFTNPSSGGGSSSRHVVLNTGIY